MAERKWFKGPAALAIDDWFSSGSVPTNLNQARGYLASGASFQDIVQQLGRAGRSRSAFIHPYGASRLQGPEFERVARQGYLEAIALAFRHDPPVPITTFWMTGAGNNEFEMHATDEADQVSVTLFVPDVEGGTEEGPEAWVVRLDQSGEAQTSQTSGPPAREPPSATGEAAS
ncbi:MAG TPA: hypothetical protein VKD88_00555 [Gaiellaceae bacterium]|nr:hypothetical protein [Gaiellaceae bacterium]